jgi:hypothetical protein
MLRKLIRCEQLVCGIVEIVCFGQHSEYSIYLSETLYGRLSTRLKQRFARHEIEVMSPAAGFENINFLTDNLFGAL